MTDLPYTNEDLRTEAAKQHKTATEDPDFSGIGEQMDGTEPWTNLGDDEFDIAMRAIDDLLTKAADVSRWAIDLGADGMEPSHEHAINLDGESKPLARIHFAFDPGMPDEERAGFVHGLMEIIANSMTN